MAKGDVVSDVQSISAAAYLDIRPSGTANWKIHNIYHEDEISIQFYDGTNTCEFVANETGRGVYAYYAFGVDNTNRIRVQNEAGTAKCIGYDGIITKA